MSFDFNYAGMNLNDCLGDVEPDPGDIQLIAGSAMPTMDFHTSTLIEGLASDRRNSLEMMKLVAANITTAHDEDLV